MKKMLRERIAALAKMNASALREEHRKVFGKEPASSHRQFLFRKIVWRLQADEEGWALDESRKPARAIARDTPLRNRVITNAGKSRAGLPPEQTAVATIAPDRDPRLPMPGGLIVKQHRGTTHVVKVLDDGRFEYNDRRYRSLSAIAQEILAAPRRSTIRCAIYTRKSTEEGVEQEFNTLDAQRDAAEAFIRSQRGEGWVTLPEHYDDGGFTGANMDRPALQKLLQDVRDGLVNCVMVYKVDRLTRSLLDFARIMEVLDKHGVSFVSVTQQFNTTSSLGRLTLNILLSFAQFEREMIAERTRDKMSAARRKGRWVGGIPMLGYEISERGGALVVNEDEAARVRAIFDLYLELGSLIPVMQELDRRGWRMKEWTTRKGKVAGGQPFAKNRLYNLLTNRVYVGKVEYGSEVYEGEHEAIVDPEVWQRVQDRLRFNGRTGGRQVRNKYGALLKGILRCDSCDAGMVHTYTQKTPNKLYRYYVCVNAHQRGYNQCPTRNVSAPAIEQAVIEQIRGIAANPAVVDEVVRALGEQRVADVETLERREAADRARTRAAEPGTRGSGADGRQARRGPDGRGAGAGVGA